jgi:curved DNA-binding protein CbpA
MKKIFERWRPLLEVEDGVVVATDGEALSILGLEPGKEYLAGTIKKAYRKAAFEVHPDRGGSGQDMLRVRAAYERLGRGVENYIPSQDAPQEPTPEEPRPSSPRPEARGMTERQFEFRGGHGQLYSYLKNLWQIFPEIGDPRLARKIKREIRNGLYGQESQFFRGFDHDRKNIERMRNLGNLMETFLSRDMGYNPPRFNSGLFKAIRQDILVLTYHVLRDADKKGRVDDGTGWVRDRLEMIKEAYKQRSS